MNTPIIKFKSGQLEKMRNILLEDLENEQYACIIAKTEIYEDKKIVLVRDIIYPSKAEVISSSTVSLKVSGAFTEDVLNEINARFDADTLIEVHTHPFTEHGAYFSSIDDADEQKLSKVINNHFRNINYGSIVFTRKEYSARFWLFENLILSKPLYSKIKTQNINESIKNSHIQEEINIPSLIEREIYNRSELMLGKKNISKISNNQTITIVGVGGIGSIIAENLIHSGFNSLILVDHDVAEVSNLNRVVGLKYEDAVKNKLKVDIVEEHLKSINPEVNISKYPFKFEEITDLSEIINSDWIIMATDNHYSRYLLQEFSFKYYIPFINVGVNITADEGEVSDISGETIIVRMGDRYCLSCLNRLNSNEIQKVLSKDFNVRRGLLEKGYVRGLEIKDPAVKTLNSIMAAITVDTLINEYTGLRKNHPITVYENNNSLKIYIDDSSLQNRKFHCSICDI